MSDNALPEPFCEVGDMELDLSAAIEFADAIIIVAETIDDDDQLAAVLSRLARSIRDSCEQAEKRRGSLFRALHPRRAEFEKTGWPAEELSWRKPKGAP